MEIYLYIYFPVYICVIYHSTKTEVKYRGFGFGEKLFVQNVSKS